MKVNVLKLSRHKCCPRNADIRRGLFCWFS